MTTTKPRRAPFALPADMTPSVDNVLSAYRRATPDQISRGIAWYADAHSVALALDPNDVERAAGVLAALSPRAPWIRTVELASRAYVEGHASGHLPAMHKVADRILAGESFRDALRGDKTRNFAGVIADPTDATSVVIDRHAVSVAIGRYSTDADTALLSRKGVYEQFAEVYRVAARTVGISPSQMQAVTWVVWRESEIRVSAAVRRGALG